MLLIEEKSEKHQKAKSIIADTFPWQPGVFKLCQGGNAVLLLNCRGKRDVRFRSKPAFPNQFFVYEVLGSEFCMNVYHHIKQLVV